MSVNLFKQKNPAAVYSEANLITLLRLSVSLTFFILSAILKNPTYNYIGLAVHWLGDVSDGFCARHFRQETVLGAEIDIISDRVATLLFYVNYLQFRPELFLPIAIYLLNFAFFDFYLSYQFIKYDIISPNYFYKVNKTVFSLNFSPWGKFCNSTVVTILLIFLPKLWILATVCACLLIGVKIHSIRVLWRETPRGHLPAAGRTEGTA